MAYATTINTLKERLETIVREADGIRLQAKALKTIQGTADDDFPALTNRLLSLYQSQRQRLKEEADEILNAIQLLQAQP